MSNDINVGAVVEAQMYFAVIPEWVLDLPISASSVRVYCCLRRYADNKTGQCWPSRRTLAMRARCSIATLDRAVKELAELTLSSHATRGSPCRGRLSTAGVKGHFSLNAEIPTEVGVTLHDPVLQDCRS